MINRLTLNNFRCFSDFVTEIYPITIISGENNSGKSSILESIFLLHDYLAPDSFLKIAAFRGNRNFNISPAFLWEPLFFKLDMSKTILICVEDADANDKKTITYEKGGENTINVAAFSKQLPAEIQNLFPALPIAGNYPLNYSFTWGDHSEKGSYVMSLPNIGRNPQDAPLNRPLKTVQYIGPNILTDVNFVAEQFGRVELAAKKGDLIQSLKLLDPRIIDLVTIMQDNIGSIYAKTCDKQTYPLRTMGDGINKLLSVVLAILANPNSILLLDEAENGFHYSFHKNFWRLTSKLAHEQRCQIIATTHSYECLQGAVDAITENGQEKELAYIRLTRSHSNRIEPKIFSKDMLEYALNSEMEVR